MKRNVMSYSKSAMNDNIDEIIDILDSAEVGLGELIHRWNSNKKGVEIVACYFEKFYLRSSSFAGASVTFIDDGVTLDVEVICYAGGQGIFNFDYGAGSNFFNRIDNVLVENFGFTAQE